MMLATHDEKKANPSREDSTPGDDPTSLGNMVVRHGLCSRAQMIEFLVEFNRSTREQLLGQFLVAKDVLSDEQLQMMLIKQEAERGGVKHSHVMKAMEVVEKSNQKIVDGVELLNDAAILALAKTAEGKAR